MDVVNEQGDMMAPTGCCKGVGGFGEEVLKLPWETLAAENVTPCEGGTRPDGVIVAEVL